MNHTLSIFAARATLTLGLGLAISLPAHAGLVTGAWDPEFGAPLSDLSWSIKAQFTVSDSCIALGDGDHLASLNPTCAASVVNQAQLRLFSTSTDAPTDFNDFSGGGGYVEDFANLNAGLTVTAVRVANGQVIGVATNIGAMVGYPYVPAAMDNNFSLGFTLDGPDVICVGCSVSGYNPGNPDITAPRDTLEQVLTTYNDDQSPKLVDANGKAIGVRLDGNGVVLGLTGTPVSEPGSLALVMAALGSALWACRRSV